MTDFWLGYLAGFGTPMACLAVLIGVATLYDYLWSLGDGK
jgi:hypothetical protein